VGDAPFSLRHLRALVREELTRPQNDFKRLIEALESVADQAQEVDKCLQRAFENVFAMSFDVPSARSGKGADLMPGIATYLEICRAVDGSGQVWIDSQGPVPLPPTLTDFLIHLASGKAGADGIAGWRSRLSLRGWLDARSRRELTPKYHNHLAHELSKRLKAAGIKGELIDKHPKLGIRFALRNPATALLVREPRINR
jgi:hypothetical protein